MYEDFEAGEWANNGIDKQRGKEKEESNKRKIRVGDEKKIGKSEGWIENTESGGQKKGKK